MLFLPGRGCYFNPKQSGLQTRHHGEYQINCFAVRHAWKSPCVSSSHCTDWSFPITQWHSRRKANQSVQVSGPTQTHLRPRNAPHTMHVKCWTSCQRTCPLDFYVVRAKMAQLVPLGLLKMGLRPALPLIAIQLEFVCRRQMWNAFSNPISPEHWRWIWKAAIRKIENAVILSKFALLSSLEHRDQVHLFHKNHILSWATCFHVLSNNTPALFLCWVQVAASGYPSFCIGHL